MFTKFSKKFLAILMSVVLIFAAVPFGMIASAATVYVLDGQISITDGKNKISESNGVVTVSAKGGAGLFVQPETNTITIYNETDKKAKLTFYYEAKNYSSFSEKSASGNYEVTLGAGESCTMNIAGAKEAFNNTATLTLNNFSLVAAADSSNVTFNYDSAYGSITVDGTAVADGGVKEIPLSGAVLVATPSNGGKFHGWVDAANGSILSTDTSYTVTPAQEMTVKAVFIGANSKPHFMLGSLKSESQRGEGLSALSKLYYWTVPLGTHLFDDLNAAATASAESATSKGIVLLNKATLPAGDYTVPSGVTLLIPFDDANTLYKTEAQGRTHVSGEENTHSYSVYRELKLASGANIIINGAMSLSAKHRYAQGNKTGGGSPIDAISQVTMESGSSITVNNGGALYAYGFITGSGAVTAKNGATVYENFQIMDFKGGTQSTNMKNGVFPMSQYYIQNIEVPLTLEYGAKEFGFTTIYMQKSNFGSAVNFIGPENCMFNLTSGYVTKRYDGSTDRLIVELNGDLTVSPISIPVGTSTLDSEEYELPINGNISMYAKSGSNVTMGQDIAMLPGSEIIVEETATCTIGDGINVYIYDADTWGDYTGAGTNAPFKPVTNAPGRTYERTNADLVDAKIQVDGTIDASAGFVYTTAGGANVFSSGTGKAIVKAGTQTITHQLIYYTEDNTIYPEIPITPVKFKNADGTYLNSATDTYTYQTDGKWHCEKHNYTEVVTAPTCSAQGYTTYTCSVCEDSYTEKGKDALGHSFGDWNTKTEAKHSAEGEKYRICSICDDKEEDIIPVIVCDYDGDGNVNGTELTKMRKFLLGTDTPETDGIKKLFDMNDNGELSIVDLVKLKKYIADIN